MKTLNVSKFSIFMISAVLVAIGTYAVIVYSSPQNLVNQSQKILLYDIPVGGEPHFVKITDMKPNSFGIFMYPNSYNFSDPANAYQVFMLIRLPAWQGGGDDNVTSFRAYSAVDLTSHCLSRYWPQQDRWRIEDPCSGDMYRTIDGYLYIKQGNPVLLQENFGLPRLELTADNDGYLYVTTPTWSVDKNGVVGIGRKLSQSEIDVTSEFLKNQEKIRDQSHFRAPPTLLSGEYARRVYGDWYQEQIYYDLAGHPSDNFMLDVKYCGCNNYETFLQQKATLHSTLWKVGNDTILATPRSGGINGSSNYIFDFYKDGYELRFLTDKSFDSGMKMILDNFFNKTSLSEIKQELIEQS